MTIYVDNMYLPKDGKRWCHLMSDSDDDTELHDFAQAIGLKRSWLHEDHYDVTEGKRALAVRLGAVEITAVEMLAIRRAKRRAR